MPREDLHDDDGVEALACEDLLRAPEIDVGGVSRIRTPMRRPTALHARARCIERPRVSASSTEPLATGERRAVHAAARLPTRRARRALPRSGRGPRSRESGLRASFGRRLRLARPQPAHGLVEQQVADRQQPRDGQAEGVAVELGRPGAPPSAPAARRQPSANFTNGQLVVPAQQLAVGDAERVVERRGVVDPAEQAGRGSRMSVMRMSARRRPSSWRSQLAIPSRSARRGGRVPARPARRRRTRLRPRSRHPR